MHVRVCGGEVCDCEDFSPKDPLPLLTGEPR